MKALIRDERETITEDMGIPGIDWNTGYPLTNEGWSGGPYFLVEDYVPDTPDGDFVEFEIQERGTGERHFNEETVTIDGKEYTREELLALLNQTH